MCVFLVLLFLLLLLLNIHHIPQATATRTTCSRQRRWQSRAKHLWLTSRVVQMRRILSCQGAACTRVATTSGIRYCLIFSGKRNRLILFLREREREREKREINIACGADVSYFIMSGGRVYACGNNEWNEVLIWGVFFFFVKKGHSVSCTHVATTSRMKCLLCF